MSIPNNDRIRERDLIADWMSRPWPNALDAPGDYYAEVIIPTLLAEVERLRGLLADTASEMRSTGYEPTRQCR